MIIPPEIDAMILTLQGQVRASAKSGDVRATVDAMKLLREAAEARAALAALP